MDIENIRNEFPILINNPDKIYFDSASTTQKPYAVIHTLNNFYTNCCANIGRGSYEWANKLDIEVNEARKKVASFINAPSPNEIVFTSGTTHSSNTIIYSWALHHLKEGDEVLVCYSDHKSAIMPWIHIKNILQGFSIKIKVIPILINSQGDYNEIDLYEKVNRKTKVINLTHIHNVFGIEMGIKEMISNLRSNKEIVFIVDASQSIGHVRVDVQDLEADFLYFSGHKMFAANGTGVLWVNKRLHSQIRPFMVGGNNKIEVSGEGFYHEDKIQNLLESGTMDIPSILTLGAAIDFIKEIGIEQIEAYLLHLTQYLIEELKTIKEVQFLPGPALCSCIIGNGIVSFKIQGEKSQDIGYVLNDYGVFIRAGSHCMGDESLAEDSIRVSLQIYNTVEEIDRFISIIKEIVEAI
ncbi:aminotransferase, class V [Alkaliphilus metalliredigens QYMF]|uniref:Aminotransferase, class V n=2 Tax=Alkaliphilus TaxID=114627 RepID=A6TNQ9_ALKMQ|nr:aminotransferase, class V [Alkaliphilus metalliredigens QYMF]